LASIAVAGFREYVVRSAQTRVFGLINISRWGKSASPGEGEIIGFLNPAEVVEAIEDNADWVRGVKVRADVDAVARGVNLDVGHGSHGFSWAVAEQAFELGLWPRSISSDLTRRCIDGPVYSLTTTLAKFLYLGMPLLEVMRATTVAPARIFRLGPSFGKIVEGGAANLSVLALVDREVDLFDSAREARRAKPTIEARYTILEGQVYEATLT